MKKYLLLAFTLILVLIYTGAFTEFVLLFKKEDGHTNWQYLANWSAFTLITLLSITATSLFFSRQRFKKVNKELQAIKSQLEIRVQERTATLDKANRLLMDTSNNLLSSEQYLKSILTSMPFMLVGLDPDGTVTQWNIKAEEYTAISAEDALGNNLWEIYPTITISAKQVDEAFKSNRITSLRQGHSGLMHYDITVYPLESNVKPGIAILIHNVSKQVKSENRIIHRERLSSMGELASSTANDINGPLKTMISYIRKVNIEVKLLTEKAPAEFLNQLTAVRQELGDALEQGNQATAIVSNLLDFASTQFDPKQQINMPEVMDHSLELANRILTVPNGLKFRKILIERHYDDNLPLVNCHVAEIQQVFLNLLRHCLHASSKVETKGFKPLIKVRAQECYNALWLKITHNGVGLTGDEQQSIFEPYFSNNPLNDEDDADKRLSFCHFIVTEHHKGEMAVTSAPNVGTTFHMEFLLKHIKSTRDSIPFVQNQK
ncbi:MAG: PAS domain-containing protein [Gammaproteobacteria bacterium]|nr:PAS domain-containing protein [Gammaproteobacteria bacterium]